MLMGEHHHNIDEKLRIIIPSKFREDLGNEIIVTRGLENCLFVYSKEEWSKIVARLNTLPFTKKDARDFLRIFISGATVCEFDKQGRIKLTQPLTTYAGLTKECIILGVNDRLEIWSKDAWDEFYNTKKDALSDLADHLFDTDLGSVTPCKNI